MLICSFCDLSIIGADERFCSDFCHQFALGGKHPIAKQWREAEDAALRKELKKQLKAVEKEIEERREKKEKEDVSLRQQTTRLIHRHAELINEFMYIKSQLKQIVPDTSTKEVENNAFYDMNNKTIKTRNEMIAFAEYLKQLKTVIQALEQEIKTSHPEIYVIIREHQQDILVGQSRSRVTAQENRENKSDFIKRIKDLQKERASASQEQRMVIVEKIDSLLKIVHSTSKDLTALFKRITKTKKIIEEFKLNAEKFQALLLKLVTDVETGKNIDSREIEKEMQRIEDEDQLMILT